MKLILVRHGQDDPACRGGWSDHDLTPEGAPKGSLGEKHPSGISTPKGSPMKKSPFRNSAPKGSLCRGE